MHHHCTEMTRSCFAREVTTSGSQRVVRMIRLSRLRATSYQPLTIARRRASTSEGEAASLGRRLAAGYVTLLGANFLSNMMIHPAQKMDYGVLNKFFWDDREVDLPFWGTRLPHLFYIPASLVFFDHTVSSLFTRFLGMQSFAATPSLALVNLFCYTWLAVGSYICVDAAFSPFHEGRRMEHVKDCIKPLTVAMSLQWHLPLMLDTFGSAAGGVVGVARNALAISFVFFPVKSLGFGDFNTNGLTPHEKKMNGL